MAVNDVSTKQNPKNEAERDWKLFRSKIVGWQESYIAKLNQEYIALLSSGDSAAEQFWALEKRIKQDKRKSGVIIQMSRSQLVYNLVSLIGDGAIAFEDLKDFSDDLRETVLAYFIR